MLEPGYPEKEAERVQSLRSFGLRDSLPDAALDELIHLVRIICETPVACVCLVDQEHQWILASEGMACRSLPRSQALCAHVILQKDLVEVEDLQQDERFRDNPAFPDFRFYAAMPLLTEEGLPLGTLTVLDNSPRRLNSLQRLALRTLGQQVMARFYLLRETREARHNYERLQLVCQATTDAIWDYDVPTARIWWSEGYSKLFGHARTSDGMPLASWTDHVHPQDSSIMQAFLRATVEGKEQFWSSHYRFRRSDGSYAEIYDRGYLVLNAEGKPVRMVGAMQDVTRSVHAEARYRELFEQAPDGIAVLNQDSIYVDANQRLCELLGFTREQFLGLQPRDIVRPDLGPKIEPVLSDIRSGGVHSQEWALVRADGTTFPADINAKMLVDGTMLTTIRDVSERHAVQAALSTAEERMRFALHNARVGVWDSDVNSGRTDGSSWLQIQFGYAPGTFPGTTEALTCRIHPDDRPIVESQFDQGDDFDLVYRIVWPNGSIRWIRAAGHLYRDERGNPKRSLGISQDITEQRSLEEQVQQSQKLEAVGRLAGGVAHDFNNLLTIILGFVEMLRAELGDSDERVAHLNDIEQAADSATALVRQLLAFSRKQSIEVRRLNLNEVLSSLQAMVPRLIGEDIVIEFRLEERKDLWVKADRSQLEQVVLNLAVNARDAMPLGGRLVFETCLEKEWVTLRVCDTGGGIAPTVLDRIFEPFFTTKEVGRGTGLGLATVHGIVTQAGGTIQVYNRPEGGACFEIRLPRC